MIARILILFHLACSGLVLGEESGCINLSKFDYEFQIVKKMAQMEVDRRDVEATLQTFESVMSDFTKKVDSFESTMATFSAKLETLYSLQDKFTTLEYAVEQTKDYLQDDLSGIIEATNKTIAFTAGLSSNPNYNVGDTVVFDTIKTNIGGGYSPDTGIFTVPTTGLYMFSVTITSAYNCDVKASIMKGNDDVGKVFADGYHHGSSSHGNYAAASITFLVELTKDDNVYVKMTFNSCNSGNRNIRGEYSFFTGLLVNAN